jgi:hypothetical protein
MLDIAKTLEPPLDTRARRVEQAELDQEDEGIDEYMAETSSNDIVAGERN